MHNPFPLHSLQNKPFWLLPCMHTLVTLFFGLGRVAIVVVDADELAVGTAEFEAVAGVAKVAEVGRVTVVL